MKGKDYLVSDLVRSGSDDVLLPCEGVEDLVIEAHFFEFLLSELHLVGFDLQGSRFPFIFHSCP